MRLPLGALSRPVLVSRSLRCRRASFSSTPFSRGNFRVSTVFSALLVLGTGATALGLYQFYTSFTLWPTELRRDLRAGIKARNHGDAALSVRYLARAYQTARAMPPSALAPDAYFKLSGIAAVLADVTAGRQNAKEVLEDAWALGSGSSSSSGPSAHDGWAAQTLTEQERLRRVALACKLAELAAGGQGEAEEEEEERWLVWAVEEVLRLAQGKSADDEPPPLSPTIARADLPMPPWMRKDDVGAPLAALGDVYAKKGKIDWAMPLYLQAISLLLPPKADGVSIEHRCQAAQLMNNLSELVMRRPPTPEVRRQAEAWARHALGAIERAENIPLPRTGWFGSVQDAGVRRTCDHVLGVALFNLGVLREMDLDHDVARGFFDRSARQCAKVGMDEGVLRAKEATRRLARSQEKI